MMMKQCFLILSVASLFLCTGCGAKKKQQQKKVETVQPLIKRSVHHPVREEEEKLSLAPVIQQRSVKERITEIEARLGDLPVPLLVDPITASDDGKGHYAIAYHTHLTRSELAHFYGQEMTRLGWIPVAAFEDEELLFSFEKQQQTCLISIRPMPKSWWSRPSCELRVYLQIK